MRFCGGLLGSEHMHLEPYLHQLLPSILTCLVGKTLCADPAVEDHWALRDLAASLLEKIVLSFGSAFVTLQPRLAKTLVGALLDFARPLTTHYGAVKGISALGKAARATLLFSNLAQYVPFAAAARDEGSALRKSEANRVLTLLIEICVAHVKVSNAKKAYLSPPPHLLSQSEQEAGSVHDKAAGEGRKRERVIDVPQISLFRDVFGAAFDKAAKQAGVENLK
jgi:hypothetical protein